MRGAGCRSSRTHPGGRRDARRFSEERTRPGAFRAMTIDALMTTAAALLELDAGAAQPSLVEGGGGRDETTAAEEDR